MIFRKLERLCDVWLIFQWRNDWNRVTWCHIIEDDFFNIDEAKKDLELYELQELVGVTPSFGEGEELESHPRSANDSGSNLPPSGNDTTRKEWLTMISLAQKRTSNYSPSSFKIEGDLFVCALSDLDEPASYKEPLNSPASNDWLLLWEMRWVLWQGTKVWELVDLLPG